MQPNCLLLTCVCLRRHAWADSKRRTLRARGTLPARRSLHVVYSITRCYRAVTQLGLNDGSPRYAPVESNFPRGATNGVLSLTIEEVIRFYFRTEGSPCGRKKKIA